jgi:hypothetical protein
LSEGVLTFGLITSRTPEPEMKTCRMPLPNGRPCGQFLFQCTTCKATGCKSRDCRNQRFDSSFPRCYACGATSRITSL